MSGANGTLNFSPNVGRVGGTITDAGGIFIFTDTGTPTQVSADLDALVFTPTAHQVPPGQTVTTGFTIQVTSAGQTAFDNATSVIATAVGPIISGTQPNQAVNDNVQILEVQMQDPIVYLLFLFISKGPKLCGHPPTFVTGADSLILPFVGGISQLLLDRLKCKVFYAWPVARHIPGRAPIGFHLRGTKQSIDRGADCDGTQTEIN
jgi:hypothetical protein